MSAVAGSTLYVLKFFVTDIGQLFVDVFRHAHHTAGYAFVFFIVRCEVVSLVPFRSFLSRQLNVAVAAFHIKRCTEAAHYSYQLVVRDVAGQYPEVAVSNAFILLLKMRRSLCYDHAQ